MHCNEKLFTTIHNRRARICNFPDDEVLVITSMIREAATSDCAAPPRKKPKRLWRTSLVVLVGTVSITMLVLRLQPPPAPFELITADDYERRTKRFAFVRDARAWMTRFSPKVFGFASVHISASYRVTGHGGASDLTKLPPPTFPTNVVQVWILSSNEVDRVERDFVAGNSVGWSMNTSEGTPSILSTGTSTGTGPGSVEFANHSKIRGGNVDLAARFTSIVAGTGNGRGAGHTTNQIAFRMFLKRGEGGIVFDGNGVLFIWAHAPPKR